MKPLVGFGGLDAPIALRVRDVSEISQRFLYGSRFCGATLKPVGDDTSETDTSEGSRAGPGGGRLSIAALTALWNNHDPAFDVELDQLAQAAAAGDTDALNRLLTTVHVLTLARPAVIKVLSEPDPIDEAMQRTLISVEKGMGSFAGRSKFRTWLHTVARNEALMVARASNRTESRTARTHEEDGLDNSPNPKAAARMSSVIATRETIRNAIDVLDEPYRTTMKLRVHDQLEYAEIASRLDVPIGTVRSRLAKAQDLMKKHLFPAGQ